MNDETHECVFPEEQEPSGRLILAPCLTCGYTAMDALAQLKSELSLALMMQDQLVREVVASLRLLGVEDPEADDHLPTILTNHLRELSGGSDV